MRAILAAVAGAAFAVPAALSMHPAKTVLARENLDGDRRLESVVAYRVGAHGRHATFVAIDDWCRGRLRTHLLTPPYDRLERADVLEPDGVTMRPEILVVVRRGTGGAAKLVRLDRGGRRCATPRTLFRYSPDAPPLAPPPGHVVADFRVTLDPPRLRRRGVRISLVERYAECIWRTTSFEYAASKRRYVRTATALQDPQERGEEPPPDVAAAVHALRGARLPMCPSPISNWFFDARTWLFANPTGGVQIFEFATDADARAIQILSKYDIRDTRPRPDGTTAATHIDWVPGFEPHWFRAGRLMALYGWRDRATLDALREVFGPEIWP